MNGIPQKQLRNQVGDVLYRVEAGETFTVTVAGRPVAELRPTQRRFWVGGAVLARIWRRMWLECHRGAVGPDLLSQAPVLAERLGTYDDSRKATAPRYGHGQHRTPCPPEPSFQGRRDLLMLDAASVH